MKKFYFLISFLLTLSLTSCASKPSLKTKVPKPEEKVAAFGYVELTLKNYESNPKYNKTYKSGIILNIKNNETEENFTVTTDENGFFYITGIKKFTTYTIDAWGITPNPDYPENVWNWTWPRKFTVSYENIANLGDTIIVWDVNHTQSAQNVEYKLADQLYEKKYKKKYTAPVFKGPESYSKSDEYKNDLEDARIKKLVNSKDFRTLQRNNPDEYIKSVCSYINEWSANDFDKARLAHDVVALILEYDAANYWRGTIPDQSYQAVIKRGTSVCAGYAAVYNEFCNKLKIPCIIVSGLAKGVGFDPESPVIKSNHDWNMVQIEDDWYLIDCTWDSGYLEGKYNVNKYSTDYLFTRPEHMIFSHYPENPQYQLLDKPFSDRDIIFVPKIPPMYFYGAYELKIEVLDFDSKKGEITFLFSHESDAKISIPVTNRLTGKTVKCAKITKTKNGTECRLSFPGYGVYSIGLVRTNKDLSTLTWDEFFSISYLK